MDMEIGEDTATPGIQFHSVPIVALSGWFPVIKEGLEEAIDESFNETDLKSVADMLLNGGGMLWIVIKDGEYAGFWITELNQNLAHNWVFVTFGYSVPKHRSFGLLTRSFKHFEAFAASIGATGVRLMSAHESYKALTKPRMGYEKRYVEYIKYTNTDQEEE